MFVHTYTPVFASGYQEEGNIAVFMKQGYVWRKKFDTHPCLKLHAHVTLIHGRALGWVWF